MCYKGDAVSHLEAVYMKRRRYYKAERLFVEFTCRNFGPCSYQVEKLFKMAGNNNKHAI